MTEPTKLQRLRQMRAKLLAKGYDARDLALLCVDDVDGRTVRLRDPDALEVIDRRIAAAEGAEG